MCKKMNLVIGTAFYNFRQWRGNTRIAATFILAFILCFLLTDKTISFAEAQGTTMQLVEAFIWSFGDSNSILLSSLLLLLLFSDMPFITTATPFFLVRGSRRTWVVGQMVYICLATFIYLFFILASTCVLSMRMSYTANSWSRTAAILAYSNEGENIALPATVKVLEMSRPYQAMINIFLLILLYTLVMVFVMMFFNVCKGQLAGVVSVLVFSVYGMLLNPENIQKLLDLPEVFYYKVRVLVGWLSPLNHATYGMHDFGYDNLPTMGQSCVIFCVLLAIFVLLTMRVMRKFSFQFKGTES